MSKRTETGPIAGGCGTPSGDEIFVKEKDKRERSKENKEKESVFFACASAGARASAMMPPVIDVRTPPTVELLLEFAHRNCGFFDDDYTREWHRIMSDELFWCHPETGTPINHWPAYFRLWRDNRRRFAALQNSESTPECSKRRGRKADNWRGTKAEDIGDALG